MADRFTLNKEIYETIREDFGGGDCRVILYGVDDKGVSGIIKRVDISILEKINTRQKVDSESANSTAMMFERMLQVQNENNNRLLEQLALVNKPQQNNFNKFKSPRVSEGFFV